ncbi:hypothetical protein Ddye_026951 [Dipteronia dyeriana]|uniref:Disease resistance RPP13-like protein 1 n=1 Tax=Dipteronia dyeriana TaxID=168575 RepID=A0AAD9TNT4_9ROSI|nr:hypothetical protein Ddye_026951 [Dipteronia dyeriana]
MVHLLVSAALLMLSEKLFSPELVQFVTKEGVRWDDTLEAIRAVLDDAEEKQIENPVLRDWLDDLQALAYDVEDVLDEYATEALRRELKIEEHQASTRRARELLPCIYDITARLDDLRINKRDFRIFETASWKGPPTSSLQTEFPVYGRDEDNAKILEMVLTDDPARVVCVISIVGMGGIGKTTVAKEVYNDKAVSDFDLKAWVCISNDFDVLRISKDILESITCRSCEHKKDLQETQILLRETVAKKKFLFVFDDVWSTNYFHWESLTKPLMVGAHGSKIILTTRNVNVALSMGSYHKCYRLKLLSDEDCWSLFKSYTFREEVMGADLGNLIRQKVIEKCKGLPLTATTLGGFLRNKQRDEWLFILDSKMWELMDETGILQALQLSYYNLRPHLKRCFAYCAIFPKDYEFEEKELVLLWMAEGLIQQSAGNKQFEELGCEYFHELLSSSFFQMSSSNRSKFIMHDLINDLAQFVSRNISYRLEDELGSNKQSNEIEKTRYSSYTCHRFNVKSKFEVFKNAKHLRSFLSMLPTRDQFKPYHISNPVVLELLPQFKKLRALSLQKYNIIELPNSIGGLRHLRYLNLSDSKIRSLSESINSLCNLQTLLLRNCRKLFKLPCNMGNLINLRHLDISGASLIVDMPMGISKWECLQTLSNFIVGKEYPRLNELERLIFLCGELHISRLENMIGFEDTMRFILSDKMDLKVLLLEWSFVSDHDVRQEEEEDNKVLAKVLAKLLPHQNIEKLTIKGYGGTDFLWVGDIRFSKLTVLKLENCNRCTHLPSLGMLGSLKSLMIKGMKSIKSIGSEFYGQPCSNSFPSLETLCFEDLEEWERWDNNKENEGDTILPSLRNLSVVRCPKLTQRLPNNLSLLEKLVIRECALLVENSIQKSTQWLYGVIFLKELHIGNCKTLTTLIERIEQNNKNIEELRIEGCHDPVPFVFRGHPPASLKRLDVRKCEKLQCLLDDNNDTSSSSSSSSMINKKDSNISTSNLEDLFVQDCRSLTCVLSIHQLSATLVHLSIKKCSKLTNLSLPAVVKYLEIEECSELTTLLPRDQLPEKLGSLKISWCPKLESIVERFHDNTDLYEIWVVGCEKLKSIPDGLHTLSSLSDIRISYCANLVSFPEGGFPNTNTNLSVGIKACEKLKALPQVHTLTSLQQLSLWDCPSLSFPAQGLPTNLESLAIQGHKLCDKLEEVGLQNITSLGNLSICGLPDILSFRVEEIRISLPPNLTQLHIGHFLNLKDLSSMGLYKLTSLQWLSIQNCPRLKSLPCLPSSILEIYKNECPFLEKKDVHLL